jgi:GNAT superfamily N-acetyltransferase
MYWRIGPEYRKRPRDRNKQDFRKIVGDGPPPGLLAFEGDLAVGWCQLTPRDSLPLIDRNWRLRRVDDLPVWCISCFYVRKGHRRKGVTSALIKAALKYAKARGASALEGYPLDAELTPSSSSTGYATTFEREGFRIIARHFAPRPILRYEFKTAARTREP